MKRGLNVWEVSEPYKLMKPLRRVIKRPFPTFLPLFPPFTKSLIQGGFFNCSAQFSVLKRKMLFNQRGSFVHQKFHGTESLIGCPPFFISVLKIGRNS